MTTQMMTAWIIALDSLERGPTKACKIPGRSVIVERHALKKEDMASSTAQGVRLERSRAEGLKRYSHKWKPGLLMWSSMKESLRILQDELRIRWFDCCSRPSDKV